MNCVSSLQEIGWRELRTLSGKVEMILVEWLKDKAHLKQVNLQGLYENHKEARTLSLDILHYDNICLCCFRCKHSFRQQYSCSISFFSVGPCWLTQEIIHYSQWSLKMLQRALLNRVSFGKLNRASAFSAATRPERHDLSSSTGLVGPMRRSRLSGAAGSFKLFRQVLKTPRLPSIEGS